MIGELYGFVSSSLPTIYQLLLHVILLVLLDELARSSLHKFYPFMASNTPPKIENMIHIGSPAQRQTSRKKDEHSPKWYVLKSEPIEQLKMSTGTQRKPIRSLGGLVVVGWCRWVEHPHIKERRSRTSLMSNCCPYFSAYPKTQRRDPPRRSPRIENSTLHVRNQDTHVW
jgi:hypothetical protein